MRKLIFTLFSVLLFNGICIAQNQSSLNKSADELLTTMDLEKYFSETIITQFAAVAKTMPAENQEAFLSAMKEFSDTYLKWEIIKPKLVKIYAREFTEDELKE